MVWGGISLEDRTDLHVIAKGTLTAVRYQDEILSATKQGETNQIRYAIRCLHVYQGPKVHKDEEIDRKTAETSGFRLNQ